MSNAGTDNLMEQIITEVDAFWVLPDRDDLKDDCIQYVFKNWESGLENVVYLHTIVNIIQFLSMKCADALSTADLDSMARAEEESKVSSYQEADQGL